MRLTTLDVGNNFISTIENLSYLRSLAELWVRSSELPRHAAVHDHGLPIIFSQINNNKIPNLQSLESQLAPLPCLETIYLEGNPCQQAEGANYRRKIMLALPKIKQIDATCVYLLLSSPVLFLNGRRLRLQTDEGGVGCIAHHDLLVFVYTDVKPGRYLSAHAHGSALRGGSECTEMLWRCAVP